VKRLEVNQFGFHPIFQYRKIEKIEQRL